MPTRVKICGVTRPQDAEAVAAAGAEALGLNFVEQSPRRLTPAAARPIAAQVRGSLVRVGVFADPEPEAVARVLETVELDVLQFHGNEPGAFCGGFGLPFMKAIRVRDALDIDALESEYGDACCLLLDAWVDGIAGGTGRRFDWSLWPGHSRLPLVLAGGLTPDNVAAAVQQVRPWAVDVAGGVEGARKGEKDPERIRRFVAEVKRAGSQ